MLRQEITVQVSDTTGDPQIKKVGNIRKADPKVCFSVYSTSV